MNHYDYIITGTGGAGLSLIHHICESPLRDKQILLIDKAAKEKNDRTWCFWEAKEGPFEKIVYRSWDHLSFHAETYSSDFKINPYQYKMIRGIDFYKYVQDKIIDYPNIKWLNAEVEDIVNEDEKAQVRAGGQLYTADWCFNSILFQPINKEETNYLDQHFKGWVIKTEEPSFTPDRATLMDFRIPQEGETRFLYVLPIDHHQALIEVAIFSNNLLDSKAYDQILDQYVEDYITKSAYRVTHEEFGVIPMTDYPFARSEGRVLHIGTAGGDTKASTGYTFWRMQEHLLKLVEQLAKHGDPVVKSNLWQKRFNLYDSTLLRVLLEERMAGDKVFTHLFKKNPPQRLLRFLNDESNILEELALMSTVPMGIFLKAFIEETIRKKLPTQPNLPSWGYDSTTVF